MPSTPANGGLLQYAVEREGLRIIMLDTLDWAATAVHSA
jgi:hypothetical protein